ncbi:hypothetical protein C5167_047873 [Papaver somniferum]|uniref:Uncharacterized protein n=1 Tax=Papaver somniferum TaxID=3469 RepID=A0A4Y7LIP5_PAPSO|nr:hypothetical protein C5167_047873 [Papaver somniferum]
MVVVDSTVTTTFHTEHKVYSLGCCSRDILVPLKVKIMQNGAQLVHMYLQLQPKEMNPMPYPFLGPPRWGSIPHHPYLTT